MNNKEFVAELAKQTGRTPKETQTLITALVGELSAQLSDENMVSVQGFGNFEVRKKAEHIMVNPSTRQRMLVPPRIDIKFRPGTTLKESLK
ncbi:MAG: HU family DNA-binding protein [Bacteroidales bacterium]|nr:HU family DNA-binding protein [Candidatus Physcousia equi]